MSAITLVSIWLTCQQVRNKSGDERRKKIQSRYFNALGQNDHLKVCPSDENNTGLWVIIDHFPSLQRLFTADTMQMTLCLHRKYSYKNGLDDMERHLNCNQTMRPIWSQKCLTNWWRHHKWPRSLQLQATLEIQGLVERQNRTLLTIHRVFCSRRIRDWNQHVDEVMGSYKSSHHATTGFSP